MKLSDQFHISRETGCWMWIGPTISNCPDTIIVGNAQMTIRQFMYEREIGEIPDNYEIKSWCGNHQCVNPSHLIKERIKPARKQKTHCKYGHELTEDNVYLYGAKRHCRTCIKLRHQKKAEQTNTSPQPKKKSGIGIGLRRPSSQQNKPKNEGPKVKIKPIRITRYQICIDGEVVEEYASKKAAQAAYERIKKQQKKAQQ